MPGVRIFFVISLAILAALLAGIVWAAPRGEQRYGEVLREGLLRTDEDWILQLDIGNREDTDARYAVRVMLGDTLYGDEFIVQGHGVYPYIHHIPRSTEATQIEVAIYREGQDAPIEQETYYLK